MADNNNIHTGEPRADFFLSGILLIGIWINGTEVIQLATKYEPVIRIGATLLSLFFAWRGWRKRNKEK